MYPDNDRIINLEDYRKMEAQLHRELINACRKQINNLGIVSIIGILDIVKSETIELEKATKRNIKNDEFEINIKETDDL